MSDTLFIIVGIIIYLIGVFTSMILVAYANREEERIPEAASILSWAIFVVLIMCIVVGIVAWPFDRLQNYLNGIFKK